MNNLPYIGDRNWKEEIVPLLNCIEDDEAVCAIADALISNKWGYDRKRLKTRTRIEAIHIISSLVQNPLDLLRLKLITRDVLYCYLTTFRPLVQKRYRKGFLEDVVQAEWGYQVQDTRHEQPTSPIQQNINNVNLFVDDLQMHFGMLSISRGSGF